MAQLSAKRRPAAEAEMGVRLPGRESCVCAADRRRRTRLRRQRQQHRVLAEREHRLPVLDVQSRRAGAHGDHDRPRQRAREDGSPTSATNGRNAYAIDAQTGALVWKRSVESFPGATITGAPTLADGTLYVVTSSAEEVLGANPKYECCKFRGSLSALNAATGEVRWKSYTIPEEPKPVRKNAQGVQLWGPSGAGVWSSPAVDLKRGAVYITTGDAYSDPAASTSDAFMAFDIKTGKLLWTRQMTAGDAYNVACSLPEALRVNCPEAKGPDHDFGSSPILVDLPNGRRALIAGQKSGVVHAVDPDRGGEILWQTRVGKGSALGGVQWGSAFDGRRVYVALSDVIPETAGTAAAPPTPLAAGRSAAEQRRWRWTLRARPGVGSDRLDHAPPRLRRSSRDAAPHNRRQSRRFPASSFPAGSMGTCAPMRAATAPSSGMSIRRSRTRPSTV